MTLPCLPRAGRSHCCCHSSLLLVLPLLRLLHHSMPASLTAPDLTTTEKVASMRPIIEEKVQNNTCGCSSN